MENDRESEGSASHVGEAAVTKDKTLMESLTVDIPLDGLGLIGFPAADAISPVYTIWITLVVIYLGLHHSSHASHIDKCKPGTL